MAVGSTIVTTLDATRLPYMMMSVSEWEVTLLDQGWHHCERAKVAIWGPPSHIWATCYHQLNYGAKHEVRLYFGSLADFQGTG